MPRANLERSDTNAGCAGCNRASLTVGSLTAPSVVQYRPCSPSGCPLAARYAHWLTRTAHNTEAVAPMSSEVRILRAFWVWLVRRIEGG